MIKAVLFDLDDTLLLSDKDAFLGTLRERLEAYWATTLNLDRTAFPLQDVVDALTGLATPHTTNQAAFRQAFLQVVPHLHPHTLEEASARFYTQQYADLRALTRPDPLARTLVESLLQAGWMVAIATNPLFPAAAIEARLRWANLDPLELDFARITHAQNSHFSKPQPEYYAEIIAHLGLEPGEVIMVGDNWRNDVLPAARLGMHTFWINDKSPRTAEEPAHPMQAGTLMDFARWALAEEGLHQLTPPPMQTHQVLPRLVGNVGALFGLIETMPIRYWTQRPDPREWTPLEIVAHLRDSERSVQRARLITILEQDNPFLSVSKPPPQPGHFHVETEDGVALAHEFWQERQQTLALLEQLSAPEWQRPARHSTYGPTSLLEMAIFTARHDQLHITQFCQTLGKCE
ncbi:MAG: HAD-IA family hydrolase [Anaerolineae bacterium]|nr:HAD-IA family hydrolase [Anaerolineae bacterium]